MPTASPDLIVDRNLIRKFKRYFAEELVLLRDLARDELVTVDDHRITVTPRGRLLVRVIAMVFDRYVRQAEERQRFSKVI